MPEGVTIITTLLDIAHGNGWSVDGEEGEEFDGQFFHPDTGELVARDGYVRTDSWRGYHDTTPADGWTKVGSGTNCGDWDDTPPGTSNAECEAQVAKLVEKHGDVVVILCPTSNVFAMGFDVLARTA